MTATTSLPRPTTAILPSAGRDGYRAQLSNTTCFFRNLVQLETTAAAVGQKWPQSRPLSVLHVGGSIGCEALSFQILLRERCPHLEASVLSTDFFPANTIAGNEARYPAQLFEPVFEGEGGDPQGWRDRWFEPLPDDLVPSYRPRLDLRKSIEFKTVDVLERSSLPVADVVFCQNVLIHMDRTLAERALANVLANCRDESVFCCAGMDLDLKPAITAAGFRPILENLETIHEGWRACRHHYRADRGIYYFELEDIDLSRANWQERYAEIFVRP